jgi:membrane-associated phospholipid phosphatase
VQVVLWLQTHGGGLQPVMHSLSLLGTEEFLLVLGLVIYWCVDVSMGLRLGLLMAAGGSVSGLIKLAFHMPRPYWYDPRVQALGAETTYGMPSTHTVVAWSIWPWLGWRIRTRWGLAAGALLAPGISASRIFLGVHFPGDVLVGFIVGLLVWLASIGGSAASDRSCGARDSSRNVPRPRRLPRFSSR